MRSVIERDLDAFYDGLMRSQRILDDFSSDFSARVDSVSEELRSLSGLTADLRVAESSPLASLLNGEIGKWQQIINACYAEAKKQVEGREFQNKFEKVPLVIVFGIVKAGKSTLGNFIHGRAFRAAPFDNVYKNGKLPNARIIVQEKGRQDASVKDAFDENSIESTCSAQYFTIPGLAWVDTPGIGAIEKKEIDIVPLAEIAKKYVQYADLVVFLANSTNPGVQEDIAGYKNLYESGKKALVVITRSDTFETKVENGKIVRRQVAKDKDRRKLQEDSLCDAMAKNGVPREYCDAVSISTQLAEKAVANVDDSLWEGGNIGDLYRKLVSVIGDPKILELKKEAPKKLWNNTVGSIVGNVNNRDSLKGLHSGLSGIHAKIQEKYDALNPSGNLVAEIVDDVVNHVRVSIRRFVDGAVDSVQGNEISLSLDTLQGKIQNEIVDVLGLHVKTIVGDFRKGILREFSVQGIAATAERNVETQEYTVEVPEIVEREPHGLFEHIRSFFGKTYHKVITVQETRTIEIDIGFDSAKAKQKLISLLENALEQHVKDELANLRQLFFAAALTKITKLKESVSRLSDKLSGCKF
jgi:hypothetical protein